MQLEKSSHSTLMKETQSNGLRHTGCYTEIYRHTQSSHVSIRLEKNGTRRLIPKKKIFASTRKTCIGIPTLHWSHCFVMNRLKPNGSLKIMISLFEHWEIGRQESLMFRTDHYGKSWKVGTRSYSITSLPLGATQFFCRIHKRQCHAS